MSLRVDDGLAGWPEVASEPGWGRAIAPFALILLPILAKLPLLLGFLNPDPLLLHSRLGVELAPGWLGGLLPTIDPNIGFTSQALGYRAALDVLAGIIPWWNPFEAVGAPLAGEMQSASLFPLTWLLALPDGQLLEHVTLQIIAGLATFALLRRLGLRRLPAFAGALVFAFNGVFAWLANAVVNPVAFLPLLLFGIETAARRARDRRSGGGTWITIGLAASLYAGFPEVAYLDGLLAAVWTLARAAALPGAARIAFAGKVAVSGGAGLLVAMPILIAFADYLAVAHVGQHAAGGLSQAALDPAYMVLVALPYVLRGPFAAPPHFAFWGGVGGYAGCALLALGCAGLFGRRWLGLRLALGSWVVVALGLTFGAPVLHVLARFVPGFGETALYRYLPATWILCLCALAAMALDDLLGRWRVWPLLAGIALLLVGIVVSLLLAPPPPPVLADRLATASVVVAAAGLAVILALILWRGRSTAARAAVLAAVLAAEAIALFVLPTLAYPRRGSVETAGVSFLRTHLGFGRFATLGPIAPNYGAYFGIASINHNDLPIPRAWVVYVRAHLDPNADTIVFNGDLRADPAGPSARDALLAHRAAYAAIGVRYVVAPLDQELPGLAEVFRDRVLRIHELPDPAPYLSAPGCRLAIRDRTRLSASCDAGSVLTRLEMAMPGWRAWVAGREVDVATTGDIFQAIRLPQGESDVAFAFEPPFMRYGYVAFAAGLALFAGGLWRARA